MRKTWGATLIVIGSLAILAWTAPSPRSERRPVRKAPNTENPSAPLPPETVERDTNEVRIESVRARSECSFVPTAEDGDVSWVEEMVGSGLWTPDRLGRLRGLLLRAEGAHERYAALWAIQCAPESVPVEELIEAYLESEADPADKAEALESLANRSSANAQVVLVQALSSPEDEVRAAARGVLALRRS